MTVKSTNDVWYAPIPVTTKLSMIWSDLVQTSHVQLFDSFTALEIMGITTELNKQGHSVPVICEGFGGSG